LQRGLPAETTGKYYRHQQRKATARFHQDLVRCCQGSQEPITSPTEDPVISSCTRSLVLSFGARRHGRARPIWAIPFDPRESKKWKAESRRVRSSPVQGFLDMGPSEAMHVCFRKRKRVHNLLTRPRGRRRFHRARRHDFALTGSQAPLLVPREEIQSKPRLALRKESERAG
jgi:hypothetical protein